MALPDDYKEPTMRMARGYYVDEIEKLKAHVELMDELTAACEQFFVKPVWTDGIMDEKPMLEVRFTLARVKQLDNLPKK